MTHYDDVYLAPPEDTLCGLEDLEPDKFRCALANLESYLEDPETIWGPGKRLKAEAIACEMRQMLKDKVI